MLPRILVYNVGKKVMNGNSDNCILLFPFCHKEGKVNSYQFIEGCVFIVPETLVSIISTNHPSLSTHLVVVCYRFYFRSDI